MGNRHGHDIAHGCQKCEQQRDHGHHEVDHPVNRILRIPDGDIKAVDGDDEHDHVTEHIGDFADGFPFKSGLQRLQNHAEHTDHHNRNQQLAVEHHLMPHKRSESGQHAFEA
ncbi:hypothetical protein D3C72_1999920 [compost metagenome]